MQIGGCIASSRRVCATRCVHSPNKIGIRQEKGEREREEGDITPADGVRHKPSPPKARPESHEPEKRLRLPGAALRSPTRSHIRCAPSNRYTLELAEKTVPDAAPRSTGGGRRAAARATRGGASSTQGGIGGIVPSASARWCRREDVAAWPRMHARRDRRWAGTGSMTRCRVLDRLFSSAISTLAALRILLVYPLSLSFVGFCAWFGVL
ncbi:hypothetical protein DFP72DRAFT_919407 [Ephemerocybe angulata]|uniref:Uncharacterized protein n=1 Tax=Ephemerocybe angulata TaxID=980116 RepID=A0A8H6HI58_9AGAR|nr:hypothetical protein DFP72DRAFT_919407 [Tulosesus angulatus]